MKSYAKQQLTRTAPVSELQAFLDELKQSDAHHNARSTAGCLVVVAAGIAFFILVNAVDKHSSLPLVPAGIGGLGLLFFLAHNRYDTEDLRYTLPAELLSALASRLQPGVHQALELDLRPSDDDKFKTAKVKTSKAGFFVTPVWRTDFQQPWLNLQLTTDDGTQLGLTITRTGIRTVTGSGKSQKTVDEFQDVLTATAQLPADAPLSAPPPAEPLPGTELMVQGRSAVARATCAPCTVGGSPTPTSAADPMQCQSQLACQLWNQALAALGQELLPARPSVTP